MSARDFKAYLRSLGDAELGRAANTEAEDLLGATLALRLIAEECHRRDLPSPLPPEILPPAIYLSFHAQPHLSN